MSVRIINLSVNYSWILPIFPEDILKSRKTFLKIITILGVFKMGIAKKIGIIVLIYLISGFVFAYLLGIGTIAFYGNVTAEYVGLVFLPIIYAYDLIAPFIGLPLAYFGA
jgi:hypothetical protein